MITDEYQDVHLNAGITGKKKKRKLTSLSNTQKMVKYRVACLMHSPCKKKPRRSASGVSSLGEEGTTRRRLRSTISVLGKKKSSQIEDQKKMCLWLVGFGVIFLPLLCASKCLAAMILKPSPKSSTRAEFEKGTPCQKSRRRVRKVSHLNAGSFPFFLTR